MKFITSLLLLFLSFSALALKIPKFVPNVVDESGTLSQSQIQYINDSIDKAQKKGVLVGVYLLPSLGDVSIEDAAEKVFKKWGLGEKGKDNGVLIILAIKDRKMRIEVGYGLEGRITDYEASQIIEKIMKPSFRAGNFETGIIESIERMALVAAGEFQPYSNPQSSPPYGLVKVIKIPVRFYVWAIFFVLIPVFIGTGTMFYIRSKKTVSYKLLREAGIDPFFLYTGSTNNNRFTLRAGLSFMPGFLFFAPGFFESGPDFEMMTGIGMILFIVFGLIATISICWYAVSPERLKGMIKRRSLRYKERKADWMRRNPGKPWKPSSSSGSGSGGGYSSSSSSSSSSGGGRSGGGGASGSW